MAISKLLVLNGPGAALSAADRDALESDCARLGLTLDVRGAESGEALAQAIAQDTTACDALIVNPGAADVAAPIAAFAQSGKPLIDVRGANIFASSDAAPAPLAPKMPTPGAKAGFIAGLGRAGYALAASALADASPQPVPAASTYRVRVINGPNLNLLGQREPHIYGAVTLKDVEATCLAMAAQANLRVEFMQSNHEGEIVDWIQDARSASDAIVINAGAYTHTSVAIHDALRAYDGYKLELHISNPHQREAFRHVSYVSLAVDAVVAGLGYQGYERVLALLPGVLAAR